MESSTTFRTVIHAIVFIRLTNVKVHFCPQKPTRSSPVTFKLHHYRDSHKIYISNCPWSLRFYEFDYTHENMNYTILDKTLGKNSSLSIIWHSQNILVLPPSPHTNVGNVMQNTVQAFGCFLKQHWNGGRGESRKNLLFIAQTNESVTFSQRVLSKIVVCCRDTPKKNVRDLNAWATS